MMDADQNIDEPVTYFQNIFMGDRCSYLGF